MYSGVTTHYTIVELAGKAQSLLVSDSVVLTTKHRKRKGIVGVITKLNKRTALVKPNYSVVDDSDEVEVTYQNLIRMIQSSRKYLYRSHSLFGRTTG